MLFWFTFIFLFVCLFFVIQGFKVQSSYSYVGTCQPALLFKCDEVFLLVQTMCAKLYVYSSVHALNINSA